MVTSVCVCVCVCVCVATRQVWSRQCVCVCVCVCGRRTGVVTSVCAAPRQVWSGQCEVRVRQEGRVQRFCGESVVVLCARRVW